jgi:hypothetical protein
MCCWEGPRKQGEIEIKCDMSASGMPIMLIYWVMTYVNIIKENIKALVVARSRLV